MTEEARAVLMIVGGFALIIGLDVVVRRKLIRERPAPEEIPAEKIPDVLIIALPMEAFNERRRLAAIWFGLMLAALGALLGFVMGSYFFLGSPRFILILALTGTAAGVWLAKQVREFQIPSKDQERRTRGREIIFNESTMKVSRAVVILEGREMDYSKDYFEIPMGPVCTVSLVPMLPRHRQPYFAYDIKTKNGAAIYIRADLFNKQNEALFIAALTQRKVNLDSKIF